MKTIKRDFKKLLPDLKLIKYQRICKGKKIVIEASTKEEADFKLNLLLKHNGK